MQISHEAMINRESERSSIRRTMVRSSFREKDQGATGTSENRSVQEAKGGELH